MKSHETYETFETFETWKFQHKYNVNSTQNTIYFLNSKVYWFFFHFYLSYTYKFQKYFFHINPKGHILKNIPQFWPPQPFLLHFYASIFFKCHNYCVFRTISLPKTLKKNKMIICETFWKSLTRLSRLLKVSSRPRLSRLVNATLYSLQGHSIWKYFKIHCG